MAPIEPPAELAGLADHILAFDHVAFATRDLEASAAFFAALGGDFFDGGDNRRAGFRWLQFTLPGEARVEAIAPVTGECFLHDFLDRRGEGLHHLTFRVDDVEASARTAEAAGLRVVGLFTELSTWKECFIHPSSGQGTVVQLAQWPDKGTPQTTLEQVLAGDIVSFG